MQMIHIPPSAQVDPFGVGWSLLVADSLLLLLQVFCSWSGIQLPGQISLTVERPMQLSFSKIDDVYTFSWVSCDSMLSASALPCSLFTGSGSFLLFAYNAIGFKIRHLQLFQWPKNQSSVQLLPPFLQFSSEKPFSPHSSVWFPAAAERILGGWHLQVDTRKQ